MPIGRATHRGANMRNFLWVAAVAAASLIAAEVSAQTYPSRPITMVVPFAAGGGQDVLARLLAPYMSETLKQPVIVENITGAGGMTGSARIARAAPDGYQLVIGGTGTHAVNQTFYKRPLYNAAIDFAPVALIAEVPLALIVRTDLPINDLPQFTRYAQVGQARMQYGSSGTGSSSHLTCVLLNAAIGVNVTHIPYRGAAPAIQELIAGRIDYGCSVLDSALPSIEGKLIRPVAVLSKVRTPSLPHLPSAHEQGLADFDANYWYALFLPRGASPPIVRKLHDAATAAMDNPSVRQRVAQFGLSIAAPERRSPEYLQEFVELEIEKWAAPIKASGATEE
jgi:tripartite-type tricarboxylate transporter receptor subunit TctC